MGYFDALTSSCFKTAQDGRKLFFPWGVWGRGYAVASEQDYERLRRQVKAYMVVALVPIIVTAALQAYVGALVIGVLLVAFYLVWMRFLLRGLLPSDERLSVQGSMTAQARAHSAAGLWFLEIGALAFVGLGIVIIVIDPGNWLIALGSIVFFGFCAAVGARMLVLRRRAATSRL
jgi:Ca2+/Na+ antiporter